MNEEEKKTTTKKTTTKKTPAKKSTAKKTTTKKATPKKEETALVEVKEEKVVKKEPKKRTTTKKKEVKALPEVKEEVKEEIVPETTPVEEVKEDVPAVQEVKEEVVPETTPVVEEKKEEPVKETTDALPVVKPEKEEKIIDEVTDDTIAAEPLPMELLGESVFDGKLIQLIGWYIIGFVLSVVTLGLGAPFAKCFILDWRFKHTKINGKRLCFDGNGLQLWGNYIKWTFFSIITLGIFLLFLPVQWNRWVVKHTHYEGNRKPKVNYSLFDGITWEYIGISVLSFFLSLFTLGLLAPFCETLMYSWRVNHTTYDTIDMEFDGKGFQLLGNYIKWTFLTIITLGIYGLWVPVRKIQWEVKHTHEKGYAKHPYRPLLGMFLPVVLAIACLGGMIFGLTKVKKDTWIQIRDDIKHYVTSISVESKKYDSLHVVAERVSDIYYRISTRDMNITWNERYERYFNPNKVDKLSENYANGYFDGEVEMAILDVATSDSPVVIISTKSGYRIFWLYEKKIENHFFNFTDNVDGYLALATDKDGEHLAYISQETGRFDDVSMRYIDRVVDYNADMVVGGSNMEDFEKNLKKNNITLSDVDIHYTTVNMNNMNGYKDAVKYYYDHTKKEYDQSKSWNEDEVNDMFDNSTYVTAYVSYLKAKLDGDAKVAVLDYGSQEFPVLVVMEDNKSYVLSYSNEEIHESEKLGKASIGALKKSTKSTEDYVLIASDATYRYYYFVEAYIEDNDSYTGQESIKVKKDAIAKNLDKYSYKEVNTSIPVVKVNKNDLSSLENKLKIEEKKEVEEPEIDGLKVGEYKLTYGDYVLKKVKVNDSLITYSILSNGSYSYVKEGLDKKGKPVVIRETGTYEIKNNKICMTSTTEGSKNSEKCFEVSNDQFKGDEGVYNYTKVKAQLLN